MADWCWIALGLWCLAVGAVVVFLALLIWFVIWLLTSGHRARQQADRPTVSPAAHAIPEAVATETPQEPPLEEPLGEQQPAAEGSVPPAAFVTYESGRLGRITIHRPGCWAIEKKGGGQRHEGGHYLGHASFQAAREYADGTGLSVRICRICQPGSG